MKLADVTTLVVVVGALVLTGLDKLDVDAMLALLGGVALRNPLSRPAAEPAPAYDV